MVNCTETADIALNPYIVRGVGEHRRGLVALHECRVRIILKSAPAVRPMGTEQPQVAHSGYRRPARFGRKIIGCIAARVSLRIQPFDPEIDLAHLEPGHLETEVKFEE